ncbi:MAG TPA: hypothetical protein GXX46_02060 [Peptococcaceae bacterium]|nr:hypothetical protein [Peptococcaceae bacterium]
MHKNGKRPTRKQKELLASCRLNPENWLIRKNLPDSIEIVHRVTGRARVIEKVR